MSFVFDVLVVGAGPAGIAGGSAAARSGKRVGVLDENPRPGGQIWRSGLHDGQRKPEAAKLRALDGLESSGAELFSARQVVDAPSANRLTVWSDSTQTSETFVYNKLILATGARERFLPFPGWTLPGVFGAGGLQALVRNGFDIRGKRVVVAGTGPLLLAVAAHLKEDGAQVIAVAEQAPMNRLAAFSASLIRHPRKLVQAIQLKTALAGVPYRTGCWPTVAHGDGHVAAVSLTNGDRVWTESCDLLACGFHLVPNTELASLLGCDIGTNGVVVDINQQTSVPDVYCAGEPTGIAGVDSAELQGQIAGLAATGLLTEAARLHGRRDAEGRIGKAMDRVFALRPDILRLAEPETIVCRCEDVRLRDLQLHANQHSVWTDVKLQTRCGMGPCQGRICGSAVEAVFGWHNASVRPPIFPVPLETFCAQTPDPQVETADPAMHV